MEILAVQPQLIKVAEQFTRYPGGRFRSMGPHSGEAFRDDVLIPALLRDPEGEVVVYLDGVAGYPASFLEEAFGGLIRSKKFSPTELRRRLKLRAEDKRYVSYRNLAEQYLADAISRLQ